MEFVDDLAKAHMDTNSLKQVHSCLDHYTHYASRFKKPRCHDKTICLVIPYHPMWDKAGLNKVMSVISLQFASELKLVGFTPKFNVSWSLPSRNLGVLLRSGNGCCIP